MHQDAIWFSSPAKNWLQKLPIGNGHIGAMLGGDPAFDVIQLNDDSLWSGYPRDYCKPDFEENIRLARELLLQDKRAEAEELIESKLTSRFTQAYLPLGDVTVRATAGTIEQYTRSLDLSCGVHTARYLLDGAWVTSESFASYPDDVLMHRISCASAQNFEISFDSKLPYDVQYDEKGFSAGGTAPSDLIIGDVGHFASEKNQMVYDEPDRATHFSVCTHVETDGTVTAGASGLFIAGATTLLLVLCSATDFSKRAGYADYAEDRVRQVAIKGFIAVKEAHVQDHAALFNRMSLQLGEPGEDASGEERMQRMRRGEATGDDFALLFQYGRYLLIGSSRLGTQAANLQGIWNQDLIPPWWSGYTLNINLQMNYWLADRTSLSDCFEPFAAFTKRLCEAGKRTAREDYGAQGSVAHHQSDIWAHATPVGLDRERIPQTARYSMWNMALPWLCLQLYDHYRYDRDDSFLKETLYPAMRETALFLKSTFTRTETGLCNIPSTSPENMYLDRKGVARAVCTMCAMDIGISREFALAYADVCGVRGEADEAARWKQFSQDVRDYAVMANGELREWDDDFAQSESGHRHFSMLFGIYPGESLLVSHFMDAARKSLRQRLENGSGQTGWSACWAELILARFGEGDMAYEILEQLLRENIHDNLFGAHPPELFQIDANFGFTIAICELLIQETQGVVRLLPALPKQFPNGNLRGVRIHGGHTMSFGWKNGALSWLEIVPGRDGELILCGAGLEQFGLASTQEGRYRLSLYAGETQLFGEPETGNSQS